VTAPGDRYRAPDLLAFARTLLERAGLAHDRAQDVAEVLLEADLLGHTTHGLAMLPKYLRDLDEGRMAKVGDPVTLADHGAALTWDGGYLPGPWLIRRAIAFAQLRLGSHPVVTVAVRRSHHIGCLQVYLKPVTDAGLVIVLTCSDPSGGGVAPYGSVAPLITPNPIAAGFPTGGSPVLIDVSLSTTSNATTKRAADEGRRLPGPWLVDPEGHPTDDPAVLFAQPPGALLPLGGQDLGYKGFALALLVEALTSGLAGHGRADGPRNWGASVFLQLIDPEAFGGRAAFLRETTALAALCRNAPVAGDHPAVRLPGDGALARRAHQIEAGVDLHPSILPSLAPWAERYGVALSGL
jgi:LDH2 family malate/lactate/ureidoglycolate dehydrogenase